MSISIFFICREGKHWSSKNAEQLLNFSSKLHLKPIAFELGNEPNSLKHALNASVPGYQLGKDFNRLRKVLNRYPLYNASTLVGPDVNNIKKCNPEHLKKCRALKYLQNFFKGINNGILNAITWHHYYLNGHNATLKDFLNVKTLENLQVQMDLVRDVLKREGKQTSHLWLGETSSAFGGGIMSII